MSGKSSIEWTDATWNPVSGCSKVSQGCKNCYAERLWPKVSGAEAKREGAASPRPFTSVRCHPERLDWPLHKRDPQRIFVNSMSDLFHEDVPDDFIDRVFAIMALAHQHTFQILTKRPERMLQYLTTPNSENITSVRVGLEALACYLREQAVNPRSTLGKGVLLQGSDINPGAVHRWPLPNVQLGVSCENQPTADERIEQLLQTPAAVRFISAEPLLANIELLTAGYFRDPRFGHPEVNAGIDWVIAGGESGPHARPSHPDWFRSLRDQCKAAGVPFMFKQWGQWADTGPASARTCAVDHDGRITASMARESFPSDATSADRWHSMYRVGKKAAGRVLDGRTHDEFPA